MAKIEDFQFQLELAVRDYECDMQGIVNNSVYQNYMEHTRHEFIKTMGLDFAALCAADIIVVVARIEIAFKNSLKSSDVFVSCSSIRKEGVKYIFDQAIYNKENGQVIATGKVTTVARVKGKLAHSADIDEAIEKMNK
jgi:acyl-CoA thioester hydrolase